jgi:hypothetical protein
MRLGRRRRSFVLGVLLLCVVTGASVLSHAEAAPQANTFTGQCQFSGQVSFDPPLTNEPQSVSQRAVADGLCSGEFVDRRGRTHELSDAPVRFSELSEAENASCLGGTATGTATLRFPDGKIRGTFEEERGGGSAVITMTGAESGSMTGVAMVSQSEDPADIAQRCGSSGLNEVRIDAEATTSPSISG